MKVYSVVKVDPLPGEKATKSGDLSLLSGSAQSQVWRWHWERLYLPHLPREVPHWWCNAWKHQCVSLGDRGALLQALMATVGV